MQLTFIDLSIIGAYLITVVVIGLLLKRRASKNLDSYLLGGKTLPWYMLSLSNASGMFDISGTMWLVTLLFVYGLKSIWIPWMWPVFNQIFLMVFLSVWLRRSNVLTGAEWIRTRFGDDTGGMLSHAIVVVFALVGVLGFLAYGFVGIGKFVEIFVPWSVVAPYVPFEVSPEYVPHFYGIIFTAIATFYVMVGGMLSIVWADLLQFGIMTLSAFVIAAIAMSKVSHADLVAATPAGWTNPFFGWELGLNWRDVLAEVNSKVQSDGYSLFTILMGMMIFKGLFISAAGPQPNYDMQKILATRSPKEGAMMSGFVSVVLMPIRYLMIAGFAVLALVFYHELNISKGDVIDFEQILPAAILEFAPVGILGLILAGLLAAFMSTFASTVNAAPAYLVNDIYKRYINPNANSKRLVYASYAVSVGVVVFSTVIGLFVSSINSLLVWLVSGLWGGYTAANVLKWYWWRLNGLGYFIGMVVGLICALAFPPLFKVVLPGVAPDILPLYLFPVVLILSGLGCIFGSIYTEAEDMERLKSFYRNVRPWGFWGPVLKAVQEDDPTYTRNPYFKRDMMNIAIGTVLQTALVALPIFIVIKAPFGIVTSAIITGITALILYKTWYKNLLDWPSEEMARENAAKQA